MKHIVSSESRCQDSGSYVFKDLVLERKRAVLKENVTIPAQSEMIVSCLLKGPSSQIQCNGTMGLTSRYEPLFNKKGVLAASCACKVDNSTIPVQVLNVSLDPVTLWTNQTISYFDPEATLCGISLEDLPEDATVPLKCQESSFDVTSLDLGTDMDEEQKAQMLELLKRYKHLFALSLSQLGVCDLIRYDIETEGGPVSQSPYRTSPMEREQITQHTKELLKSGLAKPCCSEWASPVLLVPKQDGSTRFCIDYRKLNAVTKHVAAP